MTQLTSARTISSAESRLITGVCAAHMMSHYYMLVLAPLLAFVRADFNVSYTELALALTVFNVVSGVLQTPVGFVVLAVLIAQREPVAALRPASRSGKGASHVAGTGWRLLLTPAILLNLVFFTLTAIMGNGLNTYLVVALGALHATPPAIANIALTSLLAMNAIGVLAGGVLASRMRRHVLIAASGLTIGGVITAPIGLVPLSFPP